MDRQIERLMQDSELRKAFGSRVKQLRKQRHWSQKELATQVGIRFQLLNKYEGGQHIPPPETLIKLADALDVTVDYLLTGNPVEDSPLASTQLFKRFKALEGFEEEDQQTVINVIDAIIAKRQVEVARETGAQALSHGATGKGNDQVRFELAYAALAPRAEVISPWKDREFLDRFQGRKDLLRYAEENKIEVEATASKPYSSDENLMHRSYEAGILEDPMQEPPPDMFKLTVSPREAADDPTRLEISFKDARPVEVLNLDDGTRVEDPLELFCYLNEVGGRNGIGRIDMVENRFVGIKSRGVYETPGGTVLHEALRDLEGIAMDREVLRLRDSLSPRFTHLIYNGFWFSPEMDFVRAAFDQAESLIDGKVRLELYKGGVHVLGRESPSSLYDRNLSSMDVEGGYDQADARGFIRINSLRLRAHKVILRGAGER